MTKLGFTIRIVGIAASLGVLAVSLFGAPGAYVNAAYWLFIAIAVSALLAFALAFLPKLRVSSWLVALNGLVIAGSIFVVAIQTAFDQNIRSAASETRVALNSLENTTAELALSVSEPKPISDTDLASTVVLLNQLWYLPLGFDQSVSAEQAGQSNLFTFGLANITTLQAAGETAYRRTLSHQFLPRLLLRLEQQMIANVSNPDFLYEALRMYLMLGQQGPIDQNLVKDWMALDWATAYPGLGNEALRNDLARHLHLLLSVPFDQIALNGPLVEEVQSILSKVPLAQLMYDQILNSPQARQLPDFRITDVGGPAVSRVIVRSSGKPLNEGIDGIFTREGFNTVVLNEILDVADRVMSEIWILGPQFTTPQNDAALAMLGRDVLDLYYTDYILAYDQLLGDIDIVPIDSLSHAVDVTNVLSGRVSPIANILQAVADETRLTLDQRRPSAEQLAEQRRSGDFFGALESFSRWKLLLETSRNTLGGNAAVPGEFVENRFLWLQELTERFDLRPSQLDVVMDSLTDVYQELNKLSFSGVDTGTIGEIPSIARFQALTDALPNPLPRWASQISEGVTSLAASETTRATINARWQADVLPFCTNALNNRYPFSRGASEDVSLDDFARLFAPGGLLDTFFDENLREYVDTRARPWAWKQGTGSNLGFNQAVLQQMQYAAEIRDAFFPNGDTLSVAFQIMPEALDPNAQGVDLMIDGQAVSYRLGPPPTPSALTWPGTEQSASVSLIPALSGTTSAIETSGPWAWFRLLSAAEVRRTNVADRTRVIFNVGGSIAIFQLRSGSVMNPFNLPALSKFSCPTTF